VKKGHEAGGGGKCWEHYNVFQYDHLQTL